MVIKLHCIITALFLQNKSLNHVTWHNFIWEWYEYNTVSWPYFLIGEEKTKNNSREQINLSVDDGKHVVFIYTFIRIYSGWAIIQTCKLHPFEILIILHDHCKRFKHYIFLPVSSPPPSAFTLPNSKKIKNNLSVPVLQQDEVNHLTIAWVYWIHTKSISSRYQVFNIYNAMSDIYIYQL